MKRGHLAHFLSVLLFASPITISCLQKKQASAQRHRKPSPIKNPLILLNISTYLSEEPIWQHVYCSLTLRHNLGISKLVKDSVVKIVKYAWRKNLVISSAQCQDLSLTDLILVVFQKRLRNELCSIKKIYRSLQIDEGALGERDKSLLGLLCEVSTVKISQLFMCHFIEKLTEIGIPYSALYPGFFKYHPCPEIVANISKYGFREKRAVCITEKARARKLEPTNDEVDYLNNLEQDCKPGSPGEYSGRAIISLNLLRSLEVLWGDDSEDSDRDNAALCFRRLVRGVPLREIISVVESFRYRKKINGKKCEYAILEMLHSINSKIISVQENSERRQLHIFWKNELSEYIRFHKLRLERC